MCTGWEQPILATIAQLAERKAVNLDVGRSRLSGSANYFYYIF